MPAMAGMRNRSGPNTARLTTDTPTPHRAGKWVLLSSHYWVKTVRNRAVRAKSTPSVEKGTAPPKSAPAVLPATQ